MVIPCTLALESPRWTPAWGFATERLPQATTHESAVVGSSPSPTMSFPATAAPAPETASCGVVTLPDASTAKAPAPWVRGPLKETLPSWPETVTFVVPLTMAFIERVPRKTGFRSCRGPVGPVRATPA